MSEHALFGNADEYADNPLKPRDDERAKVMTI